MTSTPKRKTLTLKKKAPVARAPAPTPTRAEVLKVPTQSFGTRILARVRKILDDRRIIVEHITRHGRVLGTIRVVFRRTPEQPYAVDETIEIGGTVTIKYKNGHIGYSLYAYQTKRKPLQTP